MDCSVSLSIGDLLRIQEIGFHTANALYTHPDRKLEWNVFFYIVNGEMQVWEEGKEYVVSSGQFLFLKSGLHHWGEPKTPAGTSWYWIHFYNTPCNYPEYNLFSASFQIISHDEYNKALRLPKHSSMLKAQIIENKLDSMNRLFCSTDPFRAITLSLQSMELFLDLYKEATSTGPLSKSERTVQRVIEYIEHKEMHCLKSKEIEDHLQMNYAYLCKAFKSKTGITIHDYNAQVFVNKAMKMMRDTNQNISEISDTLGFSSPFYFSRIFKEIVGISPSEYISNV
jgi:AraC-like DNA-binding protein